MCAGPLGEAVEIGLFQYGCPYFSPSNHFLFVRMANCPSFGKGTPMYDS